MMLIRVAIVFAVTVVSVNVLAQEQSTKNVATVKAAVDAYRQDREAEILGDFVELLSIRNVATNLSDMERNADHIIGLLEPRGFKTQRLSAGGAPYIYAELNSPGATETILIYAHFDGQPVQEENWAYPPFSPTLLDGPVQAGAQTIDMAEVSGSFHPEWRLYARSAGDDKMPIVALVHTLDALERGSPTIGRIIEENASLFDADLLLFCDGPMHQSRQAQIVFGVRGSTTVDITTYGATRPLHSGHYGNWAPNPVMQLSHLLASMRDESGRILVDGYYDDVAPLSELERDAIANMPDVTETLKNELSIHTPEGDGMRLEELISLPAINVRGIQAGGVGAKGRNIVLSTATTSLDLRLVPDQTPKRAVELVTAHLVAQGFHVVFEEPTADILRAHEKVAKLDWHDAGYPALRTALDQSMSLRLTDLMRKIAPDLIVTPTMGGSLPLHEFGSRLDAPIIILPLANHDNNQHAENENIRLKNIWDAMQVYGAVLGSFGNR